MQVKYGAGIDCECATNTLLVNLFNIKNYKTGDCVNF